MLLFIIVVSDGLWHSHKSVQLSLAYAFHMQRSEILGKKSPTSFNDICMECNNQCSKTICMKAGALTDDYIPIWNCRSPKTYLKLFTTL
jgi:hypothetical protein